MPELVAIPDLVAGPNAHGTLRVDRRANGASTPNNATPMVLLGGMTQTLASWSGQLRPLCARREVIAYEARGQGMSELALGNCSLAQHVEDFTNLHAALGLVGPVDLVGFSFGGRVALAIAAHRPHLVRRLVLSGVALRRGVLSELIVQGWIATLATGDLSALARVSLVDTLGPAYLEKHAALIDAMVKAATTRNRFEGIRQLFADTMTAETEAPDSLWTNTALAPRVQCPSLVMGGQLDRLAEPAQVQALATALGGEYRSFMGVGHTIPIEVAGVWREAVETFAER